MNDVPTRTTYGEEVILDLHKCEKGTFNRRNIEAFFAALCRTLDMERCDLHFWDDHDVPKEEQQTEPHLKGTSAIQFIMTSNVTIHTLDLLGNVYLNVFSCNNVDEEIVKRVSKAFFGGVVVQCIKVIRK